MTENKNPAIEVAKAHKTKNERKSVTLSTGVEVYLIPVPAMVIEEVASRIEDPPVPMQAIEGKAGEFENPNDPQYLRDVGRANRLRGLAVSDALITMGVEVVGGLPPVGEWLGKLKFLEKLGHFDLSAFDLDDPTTLDFLYKKYIAMSSDDLGVLQEISGISQEGIEQAKRLFRGEAQ